MVKLYGGTAQILVVIRVKICMDPGFLNPYPSHIHAAAVLSPLCSPGDSTIHDKGLRCPSTDLQ